MLLKLSGRIYPVNQFLATDIILPLSFYRAISLTFYCFLLQTWRLKLLPFCFTHTHTHINRHLIFVRCPRASLCVSIELLQLCSPWRLTGGGSGNESKIGKRKEKERKWEGKRKRKKKSLVVGWADLLLLMLLLFLIRVLVFCLCCKCCCRSFLGGQLANDNYHWSDVFVYWRCWGNAIDWPIAWVVCVCVLNGAIDLGTRSQFLFPFSRLSFTNEL